MLKIIIFNLDSNQAKVENISNQVNETKPQQQQQRLQKLQLKQGKSLTTFLEELEQHINLAISSLQQAKVKAAELRQAMLTMKQNSSKDSNGFQKAAEKTNESNETVQSATKAKHRKILDALDLALVSSGLVHSSDQFDNSDETNGEHSSSTADADKE